MITVQPPEEETVRIANSTTVEANMVFGSYNASTPALDYMYKALSDTLKQGAGLVGDMQELALAKINYDKKEALRKAKEKYAGMFVKQETAALLNALTAPGPLFEVPDTLMWQGPELIGVDSL